MPHDATNRAFVRATVTSFFFFASLNGYVLLPLYIQALGGSAIEIGFVMGVYSGVGIVCQPLVGPWVDVIGRRPFMRLGVALVTAAAVIAVIAPAVIALFAVRALQGIAYSLFFVSNFSYVIDLVPPERRGWALGIYGVAGLASTAVTPLLGEWIIRTFGFRPLFAVTVALGLTACVLAWPVRERPRVDVPVVVPIEWLRESLDEMLKRHMLIALFFGLGTGTLFAFLPTFAESLGVRRLALFYTAYAGAAMGVRLLGGQLVDTHGRRAVIVPSMFVQASATALLAMLAALSIRLPAVPALPIIAMAGLASGAAHGFIYPALAALVADQAPAARRAAVIGVFSGMILVGQTSGAFMFGYVTHALGYGPMWLVVTGMLTLGSVLSTGIAVERAVRAETAA